MLAHPPLNERTPRLIGPDPPEWQRMVSLAAKVMGPDHSEARQEEAAAEVWSASTALDTEGFAAARNRGFAVVTFAFISGLSTAEQQCAFALEAADTLTRSRRQSKGGDGSLRLGDIGVGEHGIVTRARQSQAVNQAYLSLPVAQLVAANVLAKNTLHGGSGSNAPIVQAVHERPALADVAKDSLAVAALLTRLALWRIYEHNHGATPIAMASDLRLSEVAPNMGEYPQLRLARAAIPLSGLRQDELLRDILRLVHVDRQGRAHVDRHDISDEPGPLWRPYGMASVSRHVTRLGCPARQVPGSVGWVSRVMPWAVMAAEHAIRSGEQVLEEAS